MEVGLPEKAGGYRAPGSPRFAEAAHLDLVRPTTDAQMSADRDLETQIAGWPNVPSSECEE
jgi:hypothetical protein